MIKPCSMKIYFTFTRNECFREKTGECSLDCDTKLIKEKNKLSQKRSSRNYCQRLYNEMKSGNYFYKEDPLELSYHNCGHYDIGCGRHRICICQKKKLEIKVNVSEENDLCEKCHV